MKLTINIPATSEFFGSEYTQEQINNAIEQCQAAGFISSEPIGKVAVEIQFPLNGRFPSAVFDSSGFPLDDAAEKEFAVKQFIATVEQHMAGMIRNIRTFLQSQNQSRLGR